LVENSIAVFGGQVGSDDIYEGACVYEFGVVTGGFIDNLCEIEGIKLSPLWQFYLVGKCYS
jgi:hypothetical protein